MKIDDLYADMFPPEQNFETTSNIDIDAVAEKVVEKMLNNQKEETEDSLEESTRAEEKEEE